MANEKRLIDANALVMAIDNPKNQKWFNRKVSDSSVNWARYFVNNAPTIDAVETNYGKWIFDADYSFEFVCTQCRGHVGNRTNYRFCPHCGSYMREKPRKDIPF